MVAYEGNEPYVFISYAHKDKEQVLPIIRNLNNRGFRIWYDGGVELGNEWPDFIAEHLARCACVLTFVSRNFGESHNCRQEFTFSQNLHKENSIVYLEDPQMLGLGLQMQLVNLHALYYKHYITLESFVDTLLHSADEVLKPCLRGATPDKSAKTCIEGQDDKSVAIEKKRKIVHDTLSALAIQKYGKDGVAATASAKSTASSPEVLYRQAAVHYEKKEYGEAFLLYQKAAEQGHAESQNNLGRCYDFGLGVQMNKAESVKWYRKSAEQGYAPAQYNLGWCYEYGVGTDKNYAEARKWYQKAAAQGHQRAIKKFE